MPRHLCLPPPTKDHRPPLVFVFHGHGGNARNVARSIAIQRHWPDAITLYPSPKGTPFVAFIHPGGHGLPAAATPLLVRFFKQHSAAVAAPAAGAGGAS